MRTRILMFAILALLSMFSIVFARLMSLERRASAFYTDRVRAKLAARAGIEHAIVKLQEVASKRHYSNPWKDLWGKAIEKVDGKIAELMKLSDTNKDGARRELELLLEGVKGTDAEAKCQEAIDSLK